MIDTSNTNTVELIRVPSKQYQHAPPEYRTKMRDYDYKTPDDRWYVVHFPLLG